MSDQHKRVLEHLEIFPPTKYPRLSDNDNNKEDGAIAKDMHENADIHTSEQLVGKQNQDWIEGQNDTHNFLKTELHDGATEKELDGTVNHGQHSGPNFIQTSALTTNEGINFVSTPDKLCQEPVQPLSSDQLFYKKVPIGPDFQAQIPSWEPQLYLSEDIVRIPQLYTQHWPLPGSKGIEFSRRIGEGRGLRCRCATPDSIDCTRLHVQEERERLLAEVGHSFYLLGFNEMGEVVSECWTYEEEQTFQELVKMNPASLYKNFWDCLTIAFPTRTLKELVSYYFNVFILRRRAVQNRLCPERIDSDDDETDLPEIGEAWGMYDSDDEEAEAGVIESIEDIKEEGIFSRTFLGPVNSDLNGSVIENGSSSSSLKDNFVEDSDIENSSSDQSLDNTEPYETEDEDSIELMSWRQNHLVHRAPCTENVQKEHHPKPACHNLICVSRCNNHDLEALELSKDAYISSPDLGLRPIHVSELHDSRHDWSVGMPWERTDKFLSTNGMIKELFGDGGRDSDVDYKGSGGRREGNQNFLG